MKNKKSISKIVCFFLCALLLLIAMFPLYLMVITAFKTSADTYKNFFGPPTAIVFTNFEAVIKKSNMFTVFANSIVLTGVSTALIAMFVPACAYAISRRAKEHRYYRLLYYAIISGMFIPFCALIVPLSQIANILRIDTPLEMVLLYVGLSFSSNGFLVVGYLESIPFEIDEAASIDGASPIQTFVRVIYPIVRPAVATVVILATLWIWNDFFMPLVLLNRRMETWTVPIFQYNFGTGYLFNYNQASAALLLTIIPILTVYVLMQKYIINGMVAGAVKG